MAKGDAVKKRIAKDKIAFLAILETNAGIIATACRAAKISRFTFYNWYNEDEDFAVKVDDVKERQKDFCESMIFKRIKAGSDKMIIFYASCQMRDRGYTSRCEITGKDGSELIKPAQVDVSKLTPEQRQALLLIGEDALNNEKD